jgi:hypothetical protein
MVPKFKSSFKVKASAKKSKHPFNQKYFRLDPVLLHFRENLGLKVFKQQFKGSTWSLHEIVFKTKSFSEKWVSQQKVTEQIEGLYFSKNRYENYRWICHPLHIAHVRPENMKNLKKLTDFSDQASFGLVLRLSIKWPFDVLVNLYLNFLIHPVLLSPI